MLDFDQLPALDFWSVTQYLILNERQMSDKVSSIISSECMPIKQQCRGLQGLCNNLLNIN